MKYNGSEIIIKTLENLGIKEIFGIPGGANLPLYNALYKSKIKHILTRHEQGSTFMAQGIARTKGKAGICFATSGPGATNTLTAIADAKLDSIPIVLITGQVPSSLIGTDAFQEVDTYGLSIPITKHSYLIRSAKELIKVIPEAIEIAESGRPGPVVIDVPKDVQVEILELENDYFDKYDLKQKESLKTSLSDDETEKIDQIINLIKESKKPLLYVGAGILNSNSSEILKTISEKNSIAVSNTLLGLGCMPYDHPLYIGMLGMHGAKYTNYIVSKTDLLLAFGVRFDDRATGDISKFCPNAKIVHIDIDPAEINKLKKTHISLSGDLKLILEKLNENITSNNRSEWLETITKLKEEFYFKMPSEKEILHPLNIIKNVSKIVPDDSIISTDVGQHQMWVAQVYPFSKPRSFLTSGGLGTMGFGLPVAIGAAVANKDKKIVCFTGDGSLLMNIQELATVADLNLNLTVILLNNGHLGLVRQQQELFYEKNYIASKFESKTDFEKIAKGFGVSSYKITQNNIEEFNNILKEALNSSSPSLVEIEIDPFENVFPMIPPGKGLYEMID
jgi:acetolactate synthase-1/2/3 large subunit